MISSSVCHGVKISVQVVFLNILVMIVVVRVDKMLARQGDGCRVDLVLSVLVLLL